MNPKIRVAGALLGSNVLLFSVQQAFAADGAWNVDDNGSWSEAAKWTPDVADGAGSTATFANDQTLDATITLDGNRTIGNVVFGDADPLTPASWTISGPNVLTLAGTTPTVTVGALGVDKSATIGSVIAGTSGLTKAGAGSLFLTAANTYTGTTVVDAGTVTISGTNAVTTGVLVNGGTLVLNAGNAYTGTSVIQSGGTLVAGIAGAMGNSSALTVDGTLNLKATTGGDITYGGMGTVLGSGSINVDLLSAGVADTNITSTRILNGNYSGFTGILNVGPSTGLSGGKIQFNGLDNPALTVNVEPNATVYVSTPVTKTASIILNGGDTGETLGQLRMEGNGNWAGPVTLAGAVSGTNDAFVGSQAGAGTISGIISESGGSRALTKGGAANLIVTGANTFTGGVQVLAGALSVPAINNTGIAGPLGTGGTISIGIAGSGGSLNYTGTGETTDRVINLAGTTGGATLTQSGASGNLLFTSDPTVTGVGTKTLTLNGSTAATAEFAGQIIDNSGADLTLVAKNGSGSWTLSGNNLYTGGTNVTGGVLILGSANALGSVITGTTQSGGSEIRLTGGLVTAAEPLTINGGGISNQGALRNFSGDNTYSGTITMAAQSRINSDAGTLTLNAAPAVNGAFNLVVGGAGNTTISTAMGNGTGGLVKDGAGTLTLGGSNLFTGATQVNGGVLLLDYSANDTSKLSDTTGLTLGGASIDLSGGSHAESVLSTALTAGSRNSINRSSGSAVINLNAITPGVGAALNLGGNGIATTDTLNTNGILGSWATVTVGGVTEWATNSTNAADGPITAYTGYTDITRLGFSAVPNNAAANVRIVNGGTLGNVTLDGGALTQINSLKMAASDGASTIAFANPADVLMVGGEAGGGIHQADTSGSLAIGTAANDGFLTTGLTANATAATLNLINDSLANDLVVGSTIVNNGTDTVSLGKAGAGRLVLNGANTFTGSVAIGGGSIRLGNAAGIGTGRAVTMGASTLLDLNGFNATLASITAPATAVVTDNSAGVGTTQLSINNAGGSGAAMLDGADKDLALRITNSNGGFFLTNPANSFSGGIVLTNSVNGTRMSPGGITAGAYGTGPITVGESATDKAGIYFANGNQTVTNAIVANTGLGTDRVGTFRIDGTGIVMSGNLTAGTSDVTFSTNGTGGVTATGKISGTTNGVRLLSHTLGGTALTVTLANAVGDNDYAGNTIINDNAQVGRSYALNLGAPNQIPNGPGKGSVVINTNGTGVGTLNLVGNNETINGLTGTGTVTSSAGTPLLTIGDTNAVCNFTGIISGSLALTKTGTGALTLGGASASNYTGVTTLNGGLVTAGKGSAFGASGATSGTIINPGVTLNTNNQNFGAERFTLAGGTIKNDGASDQVNTTQRLDVTADSSVGGLRRWDVRGGGLGGLTIGTGVKLTKIDSNLFATVQNPLVNNGTIQVDAGIFALHLQVPMTGTGNVIVNPGAEFQVGSFGTSITAICTVGNPVAVNSGTLAGINDGGGQSRFDGPVTLTGACTLRADSAFTIAGAIGGTGSINKTSAGTLTISGATSHSGDTTVTAGTLVMSQASTFDDASAVRIANAGTLNLAAAGSDVVDAFFIEGVQQLDGVWGAVGSGAQRESARITGPGLLLVGDLTTPFDAWALANGLDGTPGKESGKNDDPDGDGSSNLIEFAFDGDPLSGSDNAKVFVFTADSSDVAAGADLVITVAVRETAPAFSGTPSPGATIDGITYSIEGSLDLSDFTHAVIPVAPVTTDLPTPGADYEYRSFILDGSDGLPSAGFLRAKVTSP
jgi:autotransporter-associated beta strand protein